MNDNIKVKNEENSKFLKKYGGKKKINIKKQLTSWESGVERLTQGCCFCYKLGK
jgi:hypothetical protein